MKLLVLSGRETRDLLTFAACADAMREVLAGLARGTVQQPLRTVIRPAGASGLMALMPCYLPERDAEPDASPSRDAERATYGGYGVKALCIVPGNPAIGRDAHQGAILLCSARTGEPLALVNASAITEIRTAAVSAVATGLLARGGPADLAVIGTGRQARAHMLAISAERPLTGIRVAGRDPAKAERLAGEMRGQVGVPVTACPTARQAVTGAGIVVTATSSAEPVLRREWLSPGTHVNAVGACLPQARELDTATIAAAALFADSRESLAAESGDYLLARADGAVGENHVRAEIGEILAGTGQGRTGDDEITVFESLGLAAEDLAAAALAYREARQTGAGSRVEF